jgi:hypothetical protein
LIVVIGIVLESGVKKKTVDECRRAPATTGDAQREGEHVIVVEPEMLFEGNGHHFFQEHHRRKGSNKHDEE